MGGRSRPISFSERRDGLRRGRLAENGLGEIAGQHGDREGDDDRDDKQRDDAKTQPLQHRSQNGVHVTELPLSIPTVGQ